MFLRQIQKILVSDQGTTELRGGINILTWGCVLNKDGYVPANIKIVSALGILLIWQQYLLYSLPVIFQKKNPIKINAVSAVDPVL